MNENEKGGWPLCPECGKEMAISGDGPADSGGHRLRCIMLKDGVIVESHAQTLPPLGVFVSEQVGTISKAGK